MNWGYNWKTKTSKIATKLSKVVDETNGRPGTFQADDEEEFLNETVKEFVKNNDKDIVFITQISVSVERVERYYGKWVHEKHLGDKK